MTGTDTIEGGTYWDSDPPWYDHDDSVARKKRGTASFPRLKRSKKQPLDAIIAAADDAGRFLRERAFEPGAVEWKKADDPVTPLDREAEILIRKTLDSLLPGNYLGEEHGREDRGAQITYIIDPIDGTKSFVTRDFRCSVSIAAERGGEIVAGVVYDFMKDILYAGATGRTMMILANGKRYTPQRHPLSKPRIAVDKDVGLRARLDRAGFKAVETNGSIALTMAEVAAGNYDGMISPEIGKGNIWDVAAGYSLLRCRGCDVRDAYDRPFDVRDAQHGLLVLPVEIRERLDAARIRYALPQELTADERAALTRCQSAGGLGRALRSRSQVMISIVDRTTWNGTSPDSTSEAFFTGDEARAYLKSCRALDTQSKRTNSRYHGSCRIRTTTIADVLELDDLHRHGIFCSLRERLVPKTEGGDADAR